ncbi:uncharacterized protein LOC141595430 [Silene latifolia]|uniref:uncharacterized protein LOC141595430 n=1 Tax=Silene latifolia TaxID=37657 RepID=UPI003D76BD50
MVWNVQGTGSKKKITTIKDVVTTYNPTVLVLVETHMGGEHAVKLGNILGYDGHSRVNAIGFSGAVYASPNPTNRRELWAELENFARHNNTLWLLVGDFNEIPFNGAAHTWARGNSVKTRQSVKLDRALCNSEWGTIFEEAMVHHLPAIQSDHCPIQISSNGFAPINTVRRPFRFQSCWLTHENFQELLDNNWPSTSNFLSRLPGLSQKLQNWNSELFGDIFKRKNKLLAQIAGCQRELSIARKNNLIILEAKLGEELDDVLAQEELLWYQKSRVDLIKDGDRNTSYFHNSTLVRRWRNRITTLKNGEGAWTDE